MKGPSAAPASLAAAVLALAGCSIDITRTRVNAPLDQEAFRRLEVGRTGLGDALSSLGAPDKVESKSDKDYLWYLHEDTTRVGLRLESPVSFFGYRHTFARLDVDGEDTSAMRLVFDAGTDLLIDKSLRLAPAFAQPEVKPERWGLFLLPRYSYSPLLLGDAGERPFKDLFSSGHVFGGYLGLLPVPYFTFLLGGNYQEYNGDSFMAGPSRVTMDDLRLYQLEVGGRFEIPVAALGNIFQLSKLKEMLAAQDIRRHYGFFLYVQWTLGGTFSEEVGATIDGVHSGTYFDKSIRFSTASSAGFEYVWRRLGVLVGVEYQLIGAFEKGNAPLDTEAGDFQNLLLTAGLSLRI